MEKDIKAIFVEYLDEEQIAAIISILNEILDDANGSLALNTRNKNGNRLKYQGKYYFTVTRVKDRKNIIYFGVIERFSGEQVPAIILSDNNPFLKKIPGENIVHIAVAKYVGKKGIVLHNPTIDILHDIIVQEAARYVPHLTGDGKQTKTSTKKEQEQPANPPLLPIIISLVSIGVLAYFIFCRGGGDDG